VLLVGALPTGEPRKVAVSEIPGIAQASFLPGQIVAWILPECPDGWAFLDGAACPASPLNDLLVAANYPFGGSGGSAFLPNDFRSNLLNFSDWDLTGYQVSTGWLVTYCTFSMQPGYGVMQRNAGSSTFQNVYQDISVADTWIIGGRKYRLSVAVRDGTGTGVSGSIAMYQVGGYSTLYGATTFETSSEWQVITLRIFPFPATSTRLLIQTTMSSGTLNIQVGFIQLCPDEDMVRRIIFLG
jgi:hypothetical protein